MAFIVVDAWRYLRAELGSEKDADAMLQTDLGACEWFVWDLRRSNLIDRGQLDQIVGDFLNKHPGAEPPALAEFLVSQGTLTAFQTERLLQGKTQNFVLGPFTLMDSLGVGSMGTVYKAMSKTDNKWYAVKVLPRRSMWNVRIARRKVRAFEQCQHPSVVPFVDVGTSGGMHYLAWPLVEGQTLEKTVLDKGKLSPELATAYVIQACEGLELCHRQELFHGMLKPSNLMLSPDGHVKILDFGIGCLLAETEGESLVDTMSTANSVNSGLDCASPESIMDPTNLTPIGDQYSLGCVLYFCLTGQYPFPDGTAVEKMMCHQHKQPTPLKDLNPDIPDALVAVIERLMMKKPEDRYTNCTEVIDVLRPFASAAPAPKVTKVSRIPMPSRTSVPTLGNPPAVEPSKLLSSRSSHPGTSRGSHNGTAPAHPAPGAKSVPSKPVLDKSPADRLKELRPVRAPQPGSAPATEKKPEVVVAPREESEATTPSSSLRGFNLGPVGLALIVVITAALAFVAASFIK